MTNVMPADTLVGMTRTAPATSRAARTGVARMPTTARGIETRRSILAAARQLFASEGFHRTSVPSIVQAAGVGHGTFYEYFTSRSDVLVALSHDVLNGDPQPALESVYDRAEWIRTYVHHYLSRYVANLEMSKIWSEAIAFDLEIGLARRALRAPHLIRIREFLGTLDDPAFDIEIAANSLLAGLEHFAFEWFAQGDGPGCEFGDIDAAAATVSQLWIGALLG
jgi:AcrR family transcriptional regulator